VTSDVRRIARGLARGVGPIAVAVIIQSAGNLGFHAVVGRLLDAEAYGALGTVLAAMVVLGVPLGTLQTAASAMVAEHGLGPGTARRTLSRVAMSSVLPAAAVLACASGLRDYFHLDSWGEAAQLAPYLVASAVLAAARGLLLGAGRTGAVAATYLVSTALRIGLGLALVAPLGVAGALLGTLAGEVAAVAVAVVLLLPPGLDGDQGRLGLRAVGRAGVTVTGLFLFSTVDLFLARHYLHPGASGSYIAAATVAKTILALPASIMSVVFPQMVAAWPGRGRGRVLLTGVIAVAGPALLAGAVVVAAPSLVLGLLYGNRYADAAEVVRILAVVAALTSVVAVMTHAALARRAWTIAVPWAGAAMQVALIPLWHATPAQVAACSAAALVPTLLLVVALEGRAWSRRTS
jgi:hypothetical protein